MFLEFKTINYIYVYIYVCKVNSFIKFIFYLNLNNTVYYGIQF